MRCTCFKRKKIIITDIYIENWGNGTGALEMLEQEYLNPYQVLFICLGCFQLLQIHSYPKLAAMDANLHYTSNQ